MSLTVPDGHYLVCHDYGMGGVWWFIRAGSPDEIRNASSDLMVFEQVPDWMLDKDCNSLPRDNLENPQTETLRIILAGKN